LGYPDEVRRHVVARPPGLVQVPEQFVRPRAGVLVENYRQAHLLAEPLVGYRESGAARHRRVTHRQILDLRRVDVVPAADDQILLAADDLEVAVRIEAAEIARHEPART